MVVVVVVVVVGVVMVMVVICSSVVILYVSKSYILNVLCDVICHIKVYICHCMLQGSVVHNVLFSVQYCIAKYLSQMLPQDMCHMYDMYTVYTCQLYSI